MTFNMQPPNVAVILAAGMGTRLRSIINTSPKGLLKLEEREIVKRSLSKLRNHGINRFILVTGYEKEQYESALADEFPEVEFLCNHDYDATGSMHSLWLTREILADDFLLLESDLIYETRGLQRILDEDSKDIILLSGQTDSGDEVYVYGEQGKIDHISKKFEGSKNLAGELVGISRISSELFQMMCSSYAGQQDPSQGDHYENCISDLSKKRTIPYLRIDDLVWSEIDDPSHYQRAIEHIFPKIEEADKRYESRT